VVGFVVVVHSGVQGILTWWLAEVLKVGSRWLAVVDRGGGWGLVEDVMGLKTIRTNPKKTNKK